jgi:GWxTD domain-containing protein
MTTSNRSFTPLAALLLALAAGACTSWQRVGNAGGSAPEESLLELFNPGGLYRSLGRLVSTGDVPFIGSVAMLPGRNDSVMVVVGISLGNRAFSFNREGDIYQAAYRVEYVLGREGQSPITIKRDDVVQVATLDEAIRTDESVLLQQEIMVPPGRYALTVRITDKGSTGSGVAIDSVDVNQFTPGSFTAPILVYEAAGRASRQDSLNMLLNPRGAIAFGSDTLLVYMEGVGFDRPTTVPLEVRDELDSLILATDVHFTGEREIESQAIRLAPDSVPLGQLQVVIGEGPQARTASGLVSFSGEWVITNFDALISLLRYFPRQHLIGQMRDADDAGRSELWPTFFKETDPNSLTPENELLDMYLARLAIANARYPGEGMPGWRTDRGEAFVVLGLPDEVFRDTAVQQGRVIQWFYSQHRLDLIFQDVTGFGSYRMSPSSRSDFERIRSRVQNND